jgi:hypothetical protein
VKEVRDDAEQAEPAGDEDEFIFLSQLLEDVLLELLLLLDAFYGEEGDVRGEEIASRGPSHRWASVWFEGWDGVVPR